MGIISRGCSNSTHPHLTKQHNKLSSLNRQIEGKGPQKAGVAKPNTLYAVGGPKRCLELSWGSIQNS